VRIARLCLASVSGLALAVALSSLGHAQSVTLPLPQERPHIDKRGVDLTSGQVTATETDLSIGAQGTVGLSHTRVWSAGYGWRHGYMMTVTVDSATHVTVSIGAASGGFTLSNGTYTSDLGDGATLTTSTISNLTAYTYTARDGTVIYFDPTVVAHGASYYGPAAAVATSIIAPTGVTTTLTYQQGSYYAEIFGGRVVTLYVVRLLSVNISTGYQLKFSYTSNSLAGNAPDPWVQISQVMAINNAVDYCSPSAVTCSGFSQSWPTVTYATSTASNGTTTESVTDPQGRIRTNTIDAAGRLIGIQRPTASSTSLGYVYSAAGTVQSVSVAGIGPWTYAFSTANNLLTASVTSPWVNSARTVVSSTTTHQVISDTNENGWTTSYVEDGYGRVTNITAPMGNQVSFAYDSRGNVLSTTAIAIGGGSSFTVSSATYPATCTVAATCNKPTTTTDGNGNVTNYYYNGDGTTNYVQQPAVNGIRPETHYTWGYVQGWLRNASGGFSLTSAVMAQLESVATCRTTAWPCATSDETVTSFSWEGGPSGTNLQLLGFTTAAGDNSVSTTTSYGYDAIGNVTSTTDPAGNVTTTTYNNTRQPLTVTAPLPDTTQGRKVRQVQYQYQGDGLVSQVTLGTVNPDGSGWTPAQSVLTTYDSANRKYSDELVDGSNTPQGLTQYSYDTANRPLCVAVRMNPAAYGSLSDACTLSTQGASGPDRILHYVHEYAGLEDRETNGWGTAYQQDTVHYTHTTNGQVLTITDADGNVTANAYDGFARLVRTCYNSSGTACPTATSNFEAFAYDNAGNMTQHTTRGGQTFAFSYDALNRVSGKAPPTGPVTGYGYDLQGRLVAAVFEDGSGAVYAAYDALGRMTATTVNMGGAARSLTYQYDVLGDVLTLTHPDGVYFTMAYDKIGRMGQAWWTTAGGTTSFAGYAYDDLGRRTIATAGSNHTNYSYDSIGRTGEISQYFAGGAGNVNKTFGYDAASEAVVQTRDNGSFSFTGYANVNRAYTTNALNQYVTAGPASFTYDANGNLTGDGTNTYVYDAENKLISASTSGGTTLTYDPLGRLFQTTSLAYGTVQRLYDGAHVVAEYDGLGNMQRRFFWGTNADEPLIQDEGGQLNCSGTRVLRSDELGSVVAAADCWGNLQVVNTYDEYGIPGSGNWGRYQYTGQARIPDLGMSYYKARLYSPTLGRFMQTDPIGYGDGPNWYVYVHNNPVNGSDSSGTAGGPEPQTGTRIYSEGASTSYVTSDASALSLFSGGSGGGANIGTSTINVATTDLDYSTDDTGTNFTDPTVAQFVLTQYQFTLFSSDYSFEGFDVLGGAPQNTQRQQQPTLDCPAGSHAETRRMLTTGYDNSYQSTQKNPGDPGYGQTASGSMAQTGTIAAPSTYPFGTKMYVPSYGPGTVQDRGGAIKNAHIDLWFPSTAAALNWGAEYKDVQVCVSGN
jgi:RHS repeat-associated protein